MCNNEIPGCGTVNWRHRQHIRISSRTHVQCLTERIPTAILDDQIMQKHNTVIVLSAACLALASFSHAANTPQSNTPEAITTVASSGKQWTGIAVTNKRRMFVNYPRWSDDVPISVAELLIDGSVRPYPDSSWNSWKPGSSAKDKFVCVQSVYADTQNNLWVLDPASPKMAGVVADGARLHKFDLKKNKLMRTYTFDKTVAPEKSYLNDVRIDTARNRAFITDSGLGAIIVLNLKDGTARRLLDSDKSTKAEEIDIVIDGKPWRRGGAAPRVHSDGLALDRSRNYLYYQALTGRNLYRIKTSALLDEKLSAEELAKVVEHVAQSGPADGIEFGDDGNLYLTAIEENAVNRLLMPAAKVERVIQDKRLAWPDSLSMGPNGLYVTTSQIHLGPNPPAPYLVLRFSLPADKH